jgi:phosphotriesterase-related protein
MVIVQTVSGPVTLDQLGQTMMHEHIFSDHRQEKRAQNLSVSRRELQELIDAGGQTVVDVGPNAQRHMDWYREIAATLPELQIIVCTGFYLEALTPQDLRALDEDQYVEMFNGELREGINDSGIRAGLIKVAGNKAGLTSWEIQVMRAAGRVQRETGVPICTHACEGARSQFDALMAAGADPERIYLSHVEAEFGWEGRTLKEEARYLEAIAHEGGSLYFNNFLFEFDTPHEDVMYLMHYLCDKGYDKRVLFGIDANFRFDDQDNVWWEAQKQHPETGARDFAYTYTGAMPLMRRWGFTDADFHTFLVENPKRLFSTTRI